MPRQEKPRRRSLAKLGKQRYQNRYPLNWDEISLYFLKAVRYRCCYPGCQNRAVHCHHAAYLVREGGVLILPTVYILGVHLFPLCSSHHSDRKAPTCAHHRTNWIRGTARGKMQDARNTTEYYRKLTEGYRSLNLRHVHQMTCKW